MMNFFLCVFSPTSVGRGSIGDNLKCHVLPVPRGTPIQTNYTFFGTLNFNRPRDWIRQLLSTHPQKKTPIIDRGFKPKTQHSPQNL
jgi:hypothetical protein